jgi:hypothetical protein
MKVTRYESKDRELWDSFITSSKNGTFLFQREYMDYHAARFVDHSLLIRDDKGTLVALLPANQSDDALHSHGGLTYGGVISDSSMTTPRMLAVFDAVLEYLLTVSLRRLLYKTVPHIYHRYPAEEDRYALFRHRARLYRRDVLSVSSSEARLAFQKRRQRKIAQAIKAELQVEVSENFGAFWHILEENLATVHGVKPVHSLAEIERLHVSFPNNIRLHVCKQNDEVLAGVVMFDTQTVAHVQYISANTKGRETGALDLLFSRLIEVDYAEHPYFDFGISNENDGRDLNVGLIEQKEGFGARAIVHDFYELSVTTGVEP